MTAIKCFLFCLLLSAALGRRRVRRVQAKFNPKTPPQDTKAPRNCDPKNIPRIPNFNASVLQGAIFRSRITPQQLVPLANFANAQSEGGVLSYRRPDWKKEQIFTIAGPVTGAFKFGEGQDSSLFSTVLFLNGAVFTYNVYALAVDDSTGTAAFYFEVLKDGEYDDSLSHLFIRVRDPCAPSDLSGVSDALVQFCGKEALQDDFFEVVPHVCPLYKG